eukprot:UN3701
MSRLLGSGIANAAGDVNWTSPLAPLKVANQRSCVHQPATSRNTFIDSHLFGLLCLAMLVGAQNRRFMLGAFDQQIGMSVN